MVEWATLAMKRWRTPLRSMFQRVKMAGMQSQAKVVILVWRMAREVEGRPWKIEVWSIEEKSAVMCEAKY